MEYGLLKVMAKMGISCVSSYCGAQIVEVLGLGAEVMALCLPGIPSRVGGADLTDLDRRLRAWSEHAWEVEEPSLKNPLVDVGRFRFRKNGEFHADNPVAVRTGQKAAQSGDWADYRRCAATGCWRGTRRSSEPEPPDDIDERLLRLGSSTSRCSPHAEAAPVEAGQMAPPSSNLPAGRVPSPPQPAQDLHDLGPSRS